MHEQHDAVGGNGTPQCRAGDDALAYVELRRLTGNRRDARFHLHVVVDGQQARAIVAAQQRQATSDDEERGDECPHDQSAGLPVARCAVLMCSRSRSRPKSPLKSRQIECTWFPLFCVLSNSIRNVGPCTR